MNKGLIPRASVTEDILAAEALLSQTNHIFEVVHYIEHGAGGSGVTPVNKCESRVNGCRKEAETGSTLMPLPSKFVPFKAWRFLMKIADEFTLTRIDDSFIVIPMGKDGSLLSLSESSVLLWEKLSSGSNEAALTDVLCERYSVDRQTALEDVRAFLLELEKEGILVK